MLSTMSSSKCSINNSHYHHHHHHHHLHAVEFSHWATEAGDGGGVAKIVGIRTVNQDRAATF